MTIWETIHSICKVLDLPLVTSNEDLLKSVFELKKLQKRNAEQLQALLKLQKENAVQLEAILEHGVMTDNMFRLARALGLREGKHTADSVARIAIERLVLSKSTTHAR